MTPKEYFVQTMEREPVKNDGYDALIMSCISEYGKHQYNQALDDAVKYIAPEWIYPSEYEVLVRNSKDSILKLKK